MNTDWRCSKFFFFFFFWNILRKMFLSDITEIGVLWLTTRSEILSTCELFYTLVFTVIGLAEMSVVAEFRRGDVFKVGGKLICQVWLKLAKWLKLLTEQNCWSVVFCFREFRSLQPPLMCRSKVYIKLEYNWFVSVMYEDKDGLLPFVGSAAGSFPK